MKINTCTHHVYTLNIWQST